MRYVLVICLILGLVVGGCSKKKEEIEAIEKEAAETGAGAVMDSLEGAGAGAERPADTLAARAPGAGKEGTERPGMPDWADLEGYVIQIGSYSTYDFAQMMADKYQQRDYPVFVQEMQIEGQIYYRLRVGVYETLEDAKTIGELLADRYSAEYWIDYNR